MSDNSIRRSIDDQVQRLIELYKESPDYFQGRVSQVFEEWKEEHGDETPTATVYDGFLHWFGSKLPLAYAFGVCMTEADKRFLREMVIKP